MHRMAGERSVGALCLSTGLMAVAFLLIGFGRGPAALAQAGDHGARSSADKIRSDVDEALATDGRAVVFVHYRFTTSYLSASFHDENALLQDEIVDVAGESSLRYRYRWLPAVVLEVDDRTVLEDLARIPGVRSIYPDIRGSGALDASLPFIGASRAYAFGVDGTGSVVAVLDSGIEYDHPALEESRWKTFERRFLDRGNDVGSDVRDGHGHGTHVAGIVASRGAEDGGVPSGVATGVRVISVKVLDDENRGWLSDWVRGLDHVLGLALDEGLRIDVVNMSLEVDSRQHAAECDDEYPTLAEAARLAFENDIAICGAAGNAGELGKLTTPACISSIISVGSIRHDGSEQLSAFSNRAPFLDLLAPGEWILSCGLIDPADEGAVLARRIRGTSQAAPHAAGVIALLREAEPALPAQTIRRILVESGRRVFDPASDREYSILDAGRAMEMVSAPRFRFLGCNDSGGRVSLSWGLNEPAGAILVRVTKDGAPHHFEVVSGDATMYQLDVAEAGEYQVCVQARSLDSGFLGLSSCCTFELQPSARFLRGDCTGEGSVDISDVVNLLWHTFQSPETPVCEIGCDANHDDEVDISDALYLLTHLFRQGAPPPPPYPSCGSAGPSPLGCQVSACGADA